MQKRTSGGPICSPLFHRIIFVLENRLKCKFGYFPWFGEYHLLLEKHSLITIWCTGNNSPKHLKVCSKKFSIMYMISTVDHWLRCFTMYFSSRMSLQQLYRHKSFSFSLVKVYESLELWVCLAYEPQDWQLLPYFMNSYIIMTSSVSDAPEDQTCAELQTALECTKSWNKLNSHSS